MARGVGRRVVASRASVGAADARVDVPVDVRVGVPGASPVESPVESGAGDGAADLVGQGGLVRFGTLQDEAAFAVVGQGGGVVEGTGV